MKKILIVSDTHRQQDRMRRAVLEETPDVLLHAGDVEAGFDSVVPIIADCSKYIVKGNCDGGYDYPPEIFITIEGVKILMLHGNTYDHGKCYCNPAFDAQPLYAYARRMGADVLIHGHTHVPRNEMQGGVLVINPGSTTLPRGGSEPSYAVMQVEDGRVVSVEHKKTALI